MAKKAKSEPAKSASFRSSEAIAQSRDKLWTLSVFLLKREIRDHRDAVAKDRGIRSFEVRIHGAVTGMLYWRLRRNVQPRWLKFFKDAEGFDGLSIQTQSAAAVLLIKTASRLFALSFGHGRHLLDTSVWEESFGLRVTLNAVDPNAVRTIDRKSLDANPFHSRHQAARDTSINDFGVNVDQDIVRAVTGTALDRRIGKRLAGMDSLSIQASTSLKRLPSHLRLLLKMSESEEYKKRYPWADKINEVRDPTLKAKLERLLNEKLSSDDHANMWLSIPQPIDWMQFGGIRVQGDKRKRLLDDITLDDWIDTLEGAVATVAGLRATKVFTIDSETEFPAHSWTLWECAYCEVDLSSDKYLLTSGKWFRVEPNFAAEVAADVAAIPPLTFTMPKWGNETELAYNSRVAKLHKTRFCLMDCNYVYYPGPTNRVEFCDLYGNDKKIIHVKRYSASSVLSHLFYQGYVSASLFCAEPKFRRALNTVLPESHQLKSCDDRPQPADYEIGFAIGSRLYGGRLRLPFFSQVTLRSVHRQLSNLGFRVAVGAIEIDKLADVSRAPYSTTL